MAACVAIMPLPTIFAGHARICRVAPIVAFAAMRAIGASREWLLRMGSAHSSLYSYLLRSCRVCPA